MDDLDTAAPPVPQRRAAVAGLGVVAVVVWGLVAWPLVSAWVVNAQESPAATIDATSGACFDLPDNAADPDEYAGLAGVLPVDCALAHQGQYYAVGAFGDEGSSLGDYPGAQSARDAVVDKCTASELLAALDDAAYEMDIQVYFPSADSWAEGDRAWACAVVDADAPVTGSVLVD